MRGNAVSVSQWAPFPCGLPRHSGAAGGGRNDDTPSEELSVRVRAEAMPQLATLVDADGHALAEAFPRVYNAVAAEAQKVGDCGSGGPITQSPTILRLSLAAQRISHLRPL